MSENETRDRILAAAAALFPERGYVATTTRAIAAAASVNEVTCSGGSAARRAWFAPSSPAGPPGRTIPNLSDSGPRDLAAALRSMAEGEIRDALTNGGLTIRPAFDARSVPEIRDALGEALPSRMRRFGGYLRSCQKAGQPRSDLPAEAFVALTSSLVTYRIAAGSPGLADGDESVRVVDQLLAIFWTGAAGPASRKGDT